MSPLNKEFTGPSHLSELDRRDFMKYLGLFGAMTLLSSCSEKAEKIIPFSKEIAEFTAKDFEYYTTAISAGGFAQGLMVKSFQGRPIKIEGNPLHPNSLGATSSKAQSVLYDLYHPDRVKGIEWYGKQMKLADGRSRINGEAESWGDGTGIYLVMNALHSPSINRLLEKLKAKYPKIGIVSFSPWVETNFRHFDLKKASVVVSFDEDLFSDRADHLKLARDFMERRTNAQTGNDLKNMNELYVFQSSPTLLGAKADQIYTYHESIIWKKAQDLLAILQGKKISDPELNAVALKLKKKKGVVAISRNLHPEAEELEEKINRLTGGDFISEKKFSLPFAGSMEDFCQSLKVGAINDLLLFDVDPLYQNPELLEDLKRVKNVWSISQYPTETHHLAKIRIGQSHFLEEWGDLLSPQGDLTICQPLIRPLHESISTLGVLKELLKINEDDRTTVKATHPGIPWEESLRKGFVKVSGSGKTHHEIKKAFHQYAREKKETDWSMKILPDPFLGFGEGGNNPLLQELPRPFSRLTWQNVVHINPIDARELKVHDGDVIKIKTDKGSVEAPVFISPHLPQKSMLSYLGYGQKSGSFIAKDRGFNAYPFLNSTILSVEKTKDHIQLARTQQGEIMDTSLPVKDQEFPLKTENKIEKKMMSFYGDHPLPARRDEPKWGMTIDLTSCIGCEACVISCQVENNVPFVGEDQVAQGRILHWLRIDTYHDHMKKVFFQPIPCMHCEKAPCEVVCPVNATVHGDGGINEMVYNRCVGTRYCSNNCPYKVRRFNFKAYSAIQEPWNLGMNPDVSVRDRGVMEKCTFCIQRIKSHERDKTELKTACQQVCPTNAIEFADLRDETSLAAKNKKTSRNYDLLEEEGTVPRVSYLKVLRITDEIT